MNGLNPKIFIPAVILFTVVFTAIFCAVAHSANIPDDRAIRAIIGEASGEGYEGMVAVAAALRNRGTLRGVYGVRAVHVDREPQWVWDQARRAWKESAHRDPTRGSTQWESVNFKEPYWASSFIKTVKIGKHQFYKKGGDQRGNAKKVKT